MGQGSLVSMPAHKPRPLYPKTSSTGANGPVCSEDGCILLPVGMGHPWVSCSWPASVPHIPLLRPVFKYLLLFGPQLRPPHHLHHPRVLPGLTHRAAQQDNHAPSADGAGSSVTVTRSGWAKQPRVPGARMRRAQGSWGRGTCSAPRRCRSGKHPAFQPSPEHPPRWPGWQVHRVARPWVLSPWGRRRVAPSHRPRLRRREPPWGWPSPPPCTPAGHSCGRERSVVGTQRVFPSF